MVVGYNSELVRRNVIPAPDDEVSEIPPGDVTLPPQMQVVKYNLFAIGNSKAPVHTGWPFKPRCIGSPPALPRINRLIVQIIRRTRRLRQFFPRTGAWINKPAIAKLFPRRQIDITPFAL